MKIHPDTGEKMLPKVLIDHIWSAVILTFDFLTSKFSHFIFVQNRTQVVNLVKFLQAVLKYCVTNF